MQPQASRQSLAIPVAIIIAGALIAFGIYASGKGGKTAVETGINQPKTDLVGITSTDHVRGNPNAKVVILEYSDTECPYCKRFHETMNQVMATYGTGGKVAWVYRHFPIHRTAPKEAEATECAAELGGETAFWSYLDRVYALTQGNDTLDPAQLPNIAEYVGLDKDSFTQCLDSGRHADKVEAQYAEAIASGGRGTPFNFIIVDGRETQLPGALPYADLKLMIDAALE